MGLRVVVCGVVGKQAADRSSLAYQAASPAFWLAAKPESCRNLEREG